MSNSPADSGQALPAPASRTSPCPCGSGRRYKDCHGALSSNVPTPDPAAAAHQLALQALTSQQQQDLPRAKALYEQALQLDPKHADAAHMLGMVHYALGDAAAAVPWVLRALDQTDWVIAAMRNNLGLALAKLSRNGGVEQLGLTDKGRQYRAQLAAVRAEVRPSHSVMPTVSIVVPSYNHAPYLREALASVYAQTYRHIELVVIDDGSTDGSVELAKDLLRDCPFPHQFVARENRGAHATLNDAVARSTGTYINPLNSDDGFAPERIEVMLSAALRHDARLLFSDMEWIDAHSVAIDPFVDARVYALMCKQSGIAFHETIGSAFLPQNVAVTTGNLFFRRDLFTALGGFRDFRYNHDWDFCLRALWLTEPVHVNQALYRYRFHGTNTISESAEQARSEAHRVVGEYLERAFDPRETGRPYTPNVVQWDERFVTQVLGHGLGVALSPELFKAYAQRLLSAP